MSDKPKTILVEANPRDARMIQEMLSEPKGANFKVEYAARLPRDLEQFRYRTLFEESRDAITMVTPNGKIVDFDQSVLDLFGYTREDMMRLNAQQLYAHGSDRESFQKEMTQKGFVKDYEVKFRGKDGAELDCLMTSTIWLGNNGNIQGVSYSRIT